MKKVYIAIPYTGMEESSYRQANIATALAINKGVNPFSPITHSHPLTNYNVPGDWSFWATIDLAWIDVCEEVWVIIPEEGQWRVDNSTGVQAELNYAESKGKSVKYFTINDNQLIEK